MAAALSDNRRSALVAEIARVAAAGDGAEAAAGSVGGASVNFVVVHVHTETSFKCKIIMFMIYHFFLSFLDH